MNRIACQYAIVRFAPFVETGEFANVGILMMSAKERYFGFKLETRRHGRITKFFEELEAKQYRAALEDLKEELARTHELLKRHGFDRRFKTNDEPFARALFDEIVRPRESIVRFSEPRVVLADNPKTKLNELFAYYVERNFVTKKYKETVMENGVRGWLRAARLQDRFQPQLLGDDEFQTRFPFVQLADKHAVKAIKPLFLGQDRTTRIIEYGATWALRITELRKRNKLPEHVMFAVEGPGQHLHGKREHAYQDALHRLKDTGVEVVGANEKDRVVQFAAMQ